MWGKKLQLLLKKHQLAQKTVSQQLNVTPSTVSYWLNMAYPPLEAIESICNLVNLPMWQFFTPEEIIIPDLTPEQAALNRLFVDASSDVQNSILDGAKFIITVYNKGLTYTDRLKENR